jgi:hypothetical protein
MAKGAKNLKPGRDFEDYTIDKAEIVIYQNPDNQSHLEARFEDETIWLTQAQIVNLFSSSKANVSEHIKNIYRIGELLSNATVRNFRIVQIEGGRKVIRRIDHYNLDIIISIGYRINSIRGTQFRIWANKVLKEYLLKGYAVNQRFERIENDVYYLKSKVDEFDFQIKTNLPPQEGIFYDGQTFDAHHFVSGLIKSAEKSIILIDNYIDESVLIILSKRKPGAKATIYTAAISEQFKLDIERFNAQYPEIELKIFKKSHDRFLIIDNQAVYHIGASLKDLGKKWFAFSKIETDAMEMIGRLE